MSIVEEVMFQEMLCLKVRWAIYVTQERKVMS